ncbi:sigma factor-like helix-turn-helix DNA-binding protein [Sporosarcina sp. Te-1]|uniref:sigma factor-like helix-turn-helix DNA-binding protein n=1 Tax=Sporosarcina sp. Te-1 TaxID=2818390 RepID=UPI001A9E95F8|nr:sigma factor-like helix-turn-helix DNA-binding protein [Sporosarcina sp. Te-1]QTD40642.1 helix-turn-helix domain-containing protein [Sporosarcina sp. Te-1]
MFSWLDTLLDEYISNRVALNKMKESLNTNNPESESDLKLINSMIASMTESIEWMQLGKDPKVYRGVHEKAVYQKRSYENIDLIPDIAEQLDSESSNEKHLFMSKEEKVIMADILSSFSLRERQCYLLHVAHNKSMGDIALELGISKGTVQTHINRAKKKVDEIMSSKAS